MAVYADPDYAVMVQLCLPALMPMKFYPAKYQKPRKPGVKIDTVVLHDTSSGRPFDEALRYLADPKDGRSVSIHYLIGREFGQFYGMVPEEKRANHAGSEIPSRSYNNRSIGIELYKLASDRGDFTSYQYNVVSQLVYDIMRRRGIPRSSVISHASIAASRQDPRGFDWAFFDRLVDEANLRVRMLYPEMAIDISPRR